MDPFRGLVEFRPRNGGMAEWRNGGMAEWRNGGMAEWQIVMDNGPSYSSQIELEEWQKRRAARSSCAVLGPCFVNPKEVRSFSFFWNAVHGYTRKVSLQVHLWSV